MRRHLYHVMLASTAATFACTTPFEAEPTIQSEEAALTGVTVLPTQHAGNVNGAFTVGSDGSASYSLPIVVPTGRAGIQPELGLSYSSRAGNGVAGVGWSVAGASSAITRCGRTLARDGEIRGVEFGAKDYFCLDGNRLVMIGGSSYTGDGAEYRTEHDTFARIVASGADAAGPIAFKVWSKDGRILTFGATPESRLEAWRNTVFTDAGATTPALARYSWMLNRVEDRAGNFMTISYGNTKPTVVGAPLETWVMHLDYTGFGSTAGDRSVVFGYDTARPDPMTSWVAGIQIATTHRLTSVTTTGPAVDGGAVNALRAYNLAYGTSASTGRSRVASIQLCDGNAACLAPTQLSYAETRAATTPAFTQVDVGAASWIDVTTADIDGDGADDLVYFDANKQGWVRHSHKTSFDAPVSLPMTNVASLLKAWDLNGDGKVDVLASIQTGTKLLLGKPVPTYASQAFHGVLGTLSHTASWDPPATVTANMGMLGDFDGDMVTDYLMHTSSTNPSTMSSFTAPAWSTARAVGVIPWPSQVLDLDGDGLVDLLSSGATGTAISATEIGATASETHATGLVHDVCNLFVDANGDGLPDLVNLNNGISLRINRGGSEFAPAQNALAAGATLPAINCESAGALYGVQAVDFNQDGKQDILVMGPGGQAVTVFLSNGSTFAPVNLGFVMMPSYSSVDPVAEGADARVLDANGDGLFDLLFLDRLRGELWLYLQNGTSPDLLTDVVEPMGAERQVVYAPLDTTGYAQAAAVAPQRSYLGPLSVVTQEWVDSGLGTSSKAALTLAAVHTYGPAKVDTRGDGWLGFAWHQVTDPRTGAYTITSFDQTRAHLAGADRYPFKGMPTQVTSYVPIAAGWHVTQSQTQYTWAETNGALTWFSYPSVTQSGEYEGADLSQLGHLFDATTNPDVMSVSVSTTSNLDPFGNAGQVQVVTGPNTAYAAATHDRTTVTRTFSNNTSSWIVGRPTSEITTSEAPGGATTRTVASSWDANGLLVQTVREPTDHGALFLSTTTTRNAYGLPTAVATCSATSCRSQTVGYDTDFIHVTSTTNALGFTSSATWISGLDAMLTSTDANGLVTSFTRDSLGRLRKTTRPDGSWTAVDDSTTASTPFVETSTDSTGQQVVITDDRLGREVSRSALTLGGAPSTTTTGYDNLGNVIFETRPAFSGATQYYASTVDYDALHRPLRIHQNTASNYKQLAYVQNTVTATDENGVQTTTVHDATDHVATTSTTAGQTRYQYGAFGTLVAVTDANQNVIAMTYDTLGRRTRLVDRDLGTVNTTYDAFGEIVTSTDAAGQTTTLAYDALGRRTQRSAPDGVDTWTWDPLNAKGGLASRARADVSTSWTYDALGRPSRETWNIEGSTYNYDTTYDGQGRPASIAYPDAPGRTSRFTVDHVYNQYGFLSQVRDVSTPASPQVLWTAQAMDAERHVTREALGNGLFTNRSYFADTGLLQRETTGVVYDMEYSYQANGDLAWRTDHLNGSVPTAHTESFTYDTANRLASATVSGRAVATYAYSYDALGNLASAGDSPCSGYTYGEGTAGPHALTSVTCNGTHYANSYDANGNETLANRPAPLQTVWASFGKPVAMQTPDGEMQYDYDAEHTRVKKTKLSGSLVGPSGVWSTTIFAGSGFEKRIGATTDDVYSVQAGGRTIAQLIWRESTGVADWRYLHGDRQGTVERTTDAAGALKETMSTDAWGARRAADWTATSPAVIPADTRVGYTGHDDDDEFNLVDMGGRIYDPMFKRFTSADSIVQAPYYGPSLNRYSYTFDNPLRFTDPTGHSVYNGSPMTVDASTSTALFLFGLNQTQLSGMMAQSYTVLTGAGKVAVGIEGSQGSAASPTSSAVTYRPVFADSSSSVNVTETYSSWASSPSPDDAASGSIQVQLDDGTWQTYPPDDIIDVHETTPPSTPTNAPRGKLEYVPYEQADVESWSAANMPISASLLRMLPDGLGVSVEVDAARGPAVSAGLNLQWTKYGGVHLYDFVGGGLGTGFGVSLQVNAAFGYGDWTGPFDVLGVSAGNFSGSYFRSPDGGWKGASLGWSWGENGAQAGVQVFQLLY